VSSFTGTAGNDSLLGTSAGDTFNLRQGGEDTATGLDGKDVFAFGGSFDAGDSIDGGAGNDVLQLSGNYSGGVTMLDTTMVNVETIQLGAGHNYSLTTADGNVAAGAVLTVDASQLATPNRLLFNGAAETDGRFIFFDGGGNDVLTGGAGNDTFNLAEGGRDTVRGGAGNDVVKATGTFDATDAIDGGTGNADKLEIDGLGGGDAIVFGATTLRNVENLTLDGGHSYSIVTNDATVAAGQTLTVTAWGMSAGQNLVFDGGAETNGSFNIRAGAGDDTVTGGGKADTFDFSTGGEDTAYGGAGNDTFQMGAAFDAGDSINGGDNADTLVLNGVMAPLVMTDTTMTGIETLLLKGNHSYSLTTADGNVALRGILNVNAASVGAGSVFTFDGIAELDGRFSIKTGMGEYHITGGKRGDVFNLGDTFTNADSIDGGSDEGHTHIGTDHGINHVILDGDYTGGRALDLAVDAMADIQVVALGAGHSYDISAVDGAFGPASCGFPVTFTCYDFADGDNFTLDDSAESFLIGRVFMGVGHGTYDIRFGAADDLMYAGRVFTAADTLDGGAGNDTLVLNGDFLHPDLNGDYTGANALALGAGQLTSVENVALVGGYDYDVTLNDGNVAAGATLTVEAAGFSAKAGGGDMIVLPGLGAGDSATIDGAAETDGHFVFECGGGTYVIAGGQQDDTFQFGGAFSPADLLDGQGGSDTLVLDGDVQHPGANLDYTGANAIAFGAGQLTSVESLGLVGGHSYDITTNDGNVAAGATLTVEAAGFEAATDDDASVTQPGLGVGDTLAFDGAAETDGHFVFECAGGTLTLTGGQQDDTFVFGAGYSATDTLDGQGGNDTLEFDADYSGGLAISDANLAGIETLAFAAGHSYAVTVSGDPADGAALGIDASALGAGDTLDIDLTGVTAPDVHISGGGGTELFRFGATFHAGDTVAGGGTVVLDGQYGDLTDPTVSLAGVSGVAGLAIDDSAAHNYGLVLTDDFVAAGHAATIDLGGTDAASVVAIDASAETDGAFDVVLGAAASNIATGAGDDTFDAGGFLDASDHLDGGAGYDTVLLDGDYSGVTLGSGTLAGFEQLTLAGGHAYGFTDDGTLAAGAFTVDATALGAGDTLGFDGSAETTGAFAFEAGLGACALTGSQNADSFAFGTGFGGGDSVDGQGGADTLSLDGDYSGGLALVAGTNVTSVETVTFGAGGDYDVTVTGDIAAGGTATFDGSALGASDSLTLDLASATSSGYAILGGAGADSFDLGTNFSAGDSVDGGGGGDVLSLGGDFSAGVTFAASTISGIGTLLFTGSHAVSLTMDDANVGAGQTMTVDARAAGALSFDGAAETDGNYFVYGTAGDDTIVGGAGNDTFDLTQGGTDSVTGGAGADTFILKLSTLDPTVTTLNYFAAGDSTGDEVFHFSSTNTVFHIDGVSISGVDEVSGDASDATLAADIDAAIAGTTDNAILFTVTGGDEAGNAYVIVDANGDHAYTAGTDYLIKLVTPSYLGDFGTGNFA